MSDASMPPKLILKTSYVFPLLNTLHCKNFAGKGVLPSSTANGNFLCRSSLRYCIYMTVDAAHTISVWTSKSVLLIRIKASHRMIIQFSTLTLYDHLVCSTERREATPRSFYGFLKTFITIGQGWPD